MKHAANCHWHKYAGICSCKAEQSPQPAQAEEPSLGELVEDSKLRKMVAASGDIGIAIECLRLGYELKKEPQELIANFVKTLNRTQPIMGEYYNLLMSEVFVCIRAEKVVEKFRCMPTISGSDLEFSVYELGKVVDEYIEKRKKATGL